MLDVRDTFGPLVQRVFGPGAVLAGSIGTTRRPGVLEIRVDGRTIGSGPDFTTALADVTVRGGPEKKLPGGADG